MTSKKLYLKILSVLFIWTFIFFGLFVWYGSDVVQQDCAAEIRKTRLLLQPYLEHYESNSMLTDDFEQYELIVDHQPAMDEEQLIRDAEKQVPSLPIVYWSRNKHFLQQKNASCAKYPSIFELEFNNVYWQTFYTSNGTFHLYSAYYDKRKHSPLGPTVRIVSMIDRVDLRLKTFCQFWFDHRKEPVIVETLEYNYIWLKVWGNYQNGPEQSYVITCKIPELFHDLVPSSVSMVEHECDTATNNLRVIYNRPPDDRKKNFGVCVKGLDFLNEDISVRLIEWIEMISILGADKIYFYSLQMHPNISKVLSHYERVGKVEVMPFMVPGTHPNAPGFQRLFHENNIYHKRHSEIIPYNDCFYKNLYRYKYIAVLDIDEIIMPKDDATNWRKMMDNVLNATHQKRPEGHHSYRFLHFYFLHRQQENQDWHEGIPKYMHMLQHVQRAKKHNGPEYYIKTIHNTEYVVTMAHHIAISCLGECKFYVVKEKNAMLHHYRSDCTSGIKNCKELREDKVEDKSVWKWKAELINRTKSTLATLGFFRHPIGDGSDVEVGSNIRLS